VRGIPAVKIDAIAREHLAARDVAGAGGFSASTGGNSEPLAKLCDKTAHRLAVADEIGRRTVQARLDLHTRASLTISWPAMLSARARVCAQERLGEGSDIIFYDRQV
jgi:hypothetical protein